jgi:hypothetical protein
MAIIELEYSGIHHTLTESDAVEHSFNGTALKEAITAVLPAEAVWECEGGVDEDDDGFQYYGVRLDEKFMPVFFWDDGNQVEYEDGSAWGDLVVAILELMEAAARKNAEAIGVEYEPLQLDTESKSEPVEVLEINFDWKF